MKGNVLILDYGSQFTQLISKKIRGMNVYNEVFPYDISIEEVVKMKPGAIILSGSPHSTLNEDAPILDSRLFDLKIPILGICYGYQLICQYFGSSIKKGHSSEYGETYISLVNENSTLFSSLDPIKKYKVLMSHGDSVINIPNGFRVTATTPGCEFAAIENEIDMIYGLQFHPEVQNTEIGSEILESFLFKIAKIKNNWTAQNFIEGSITEIQKKVGPKRVLCAISGGVDSLVATSLICKALKQNQITGIFIDNGLLRKNEFENVSEVLSNMFGFNLIKYNASKIFIDSLRGVIDPEKKRKIIGHIFIETFKEAVSHLEVDYLMQGTIYPDIIESHVGANKQNQCAIKSHHNVGGLPNNLEWDLIEPLSKLFKEEVRQVGIQLGLPNNLIYRHPFPGPGLGVRILGEVTEEKCNLLREIDAILIEELLNNQYYDKIWQAFAVLLESKTVGVMGDERTYQNICCIRCVNSIDGMTAESSEIPIDILKKISKKIVNNVRGVNRVLYDLTSKPPATIEWE